jgi:penicillin-binding protein 2
MSAIERFRPGEAAGAGGAGAKPGSGRVPPVSPQMAFRVAILGGIAVVMFGVIFFRLWYLQILTGEQYV